MDLRWEWICIVSRECIVSRIKMDDGFEIG